MWFREWVKSNAWHTSVQHSPSSSQHSRFSPRSLLNTHSHHVFVLLPQASVTHAPLIRTQAAVPHSRHPLLLPHLHLPHLVLAPFHLSHSLYAPKPPYHPHTLMRLLHHHYLRLSQQQQHVLLLTCAHLHHLHSLHLACLHQEIDLSPLPSIHHQHCVHLLLLPLLRVSYPHPPRILLPPGLTLLVHPCSVLSSSTPCVIGCALLLSSHRLHLPQPIRFTRQSNLYTNTSLSFVNNAE